MLESYFLSGAVFNDIEQQEMAKVSCCSKGYWFYFLTLRWVPLNSQFEMKRRNPWNGLVSWKGFERGKRHEIPFIAVWNSRTRFDLIHIKAIHKFIDSFWNVTFFQYSWGFKLDSDNSRFQKEMTRRWINWQSSRVSLPTFPECASFKVASAPAHTPKHNIGKICSQNKHNNEKTIWIISSFLFTIVGIVRIRFRFSDYKLQWHWKRSKPVVINSKRSWFRWALHKISISFSAWNSNSEVIYCICKHLLQEISVCRVNAPKEYFVCSLWARELCRRLFTRKLFEARKLNIEYIIIALLSPTRPFTQHHPGRLKNQFTEHEENKANIKSSPFKFGLLRLRFRATENIHYSSTYLLCLASLVSTSFSPSPAPSRYKNFKIVSVPYIMQHRENRTRDFSGSFHFLDRNNYPFC